MSNAQLAEQTETVKELNPPVKTFYFSSIFVSTLNNMSLQTLWGGISAMQIIVHTPLNNFNMPNNCFTIFQFMAEVVSFDLFAPTDHADFGFTQTPPFNQQFDDLGYESTNFYENLGSIGLIAVFMVLRTLFLPLLLAFLRTMRCCRCCRVIQKKLELKAAERTNFWLRFGLHTYFELLICCLVGLRLGSVIYSEKTKSDEFAEKTTWVYTILVALFFIFVAYVTLIYVRPYVAHIKDQEEFSRAKYI